MRNFTKKAAIYSLAVILQCGLIMSAVQAAPNDGRQDQQRQEQQRSDNQRLDQQQRYDGALQERNDRQQVENDRHQREMVRNDWENDQQWNDRQWVEDQRHAEVMQEIEKALDDEVLNIFGRKIYIKD